MMNSSHNPEPLPYDPTHGSYIHYQPEQPLPEQQQQQYVDVAPNNYNFAGQQGNGEVVPEYSSGGGGVVEEQEVLNLEPREKVKRELYKRLIISNVLDNLGRTAVLLTLAVASFALIAATYNKERSNRRYKKGKHDRSLFIASGSLFALSIPAYWLCAFVFMLGRNYIGSFIALLVMMARLSAHVMLLVAMINVDRLIGSILICCLCAFSYSMFMTIYPETGGPEDEVRYADILFSTGYAQFGASHVRLIVGGVLEHSKLYSGFWSQNSTTVGNTTITTTTTGMRTGLPDNWKRMPIVSLRNIVLLGYCAFEVVIVIVFASIGKFGKKY